MEYIMQTQKNTFQHIIRIGIFHREGVLTLM